MTKRQVKCENYESDMCTLYCTVWRSGGCPYAVEESLQGENKMKSKYRMFKDGYEDG